MKAGSSYILTKPKAGSSPKNLASATEETEISGISWDKRNCQMEKSSGLKKSQPVDALPAEEERMLFAAHMWSTQTCSQIEPDARSSGYARRLVAARRTRFTLPGATDALMGNNTWES